MNRRWLIAAILGLACLWGGAVKTYALGTETVNGISLSRIDRPKVRGVSAVWWNGVTVGSQSAVFNNSSGSKTVFNFAGSTTVASNVNIADIYDTRVIRISYATISNNGTPTFTVYGLAGTTTTGTLARLTSNTTGAGLNNPWSPATLTGSSATFLVEDYCEAIAISVAVASGGTTTGIFVGGDFVNEIP